MIRIYDRNIEKKFEPSDPAISAVGGLLLWVGWLFFASASAYEVVEMKYDGVPQIIGLNTLISASAAGVAFAILDYGQLGKPQRMRPQMPAQLTNAVLSGLVSINAISNDTNEYGALVVGTLGAVFYYLGLKLYARYKIDDPVEAVQVHLLPGLWGLIAVGIFSKEKGLLFSGSTN